MKVIIRNYFVNKLIGQDDDVKNIKKGKCIKEVIEFIDDDIIMTEIDELNNIIERYNIDEFDATEAIQDAKNSEFCSVQYIR